MNPQVLSELRDIHLPPPAGWWPPAPGWWILAGSVLLLGWLFWRFRLRRRRRGKVAKEALTRLEEIRREFEVHRDPVRLATRLSRLLRQVAVHCFPAGEVAGLTGSEWLTFLDRTLEAVEGPFGQGAGRALVEVPYRGGGEVDAEALLALARRWIVKVTADGFHA